MSEKIRLLVVDDQLMGPTDLRVRSSCEIVDRLPSNVVLQMDPARVAKKYDGVWVRLVGDEMFRRLNRSLGGHVPVERNVPSIVAVVEEKREMETMERPNASDAVYTCGHCRQTVEIGQSGHWNPKIQVWECQRPDTDPDRLRVLVLVPSETHWSPDLPGCEVYYDVPSGVNFGVSEIARTCGEVERRKIDCVLIDKDYPRAIEISQSLNGPHCKKRAMVVHHWNDLPFLFKFIGVPFNKKDHGVYSKYVVHRADGKPINWCFVLEDNDPLAIWSLDRYAREARAHGYSKLAAELLERVEKMRSAQPETGPGAQPSR